MSEEVEGVEDTVKKSFDNGAGGIKSRKSDGIKPTARNASRYGPSRYKKSRRLYIDTGPVDVVNGVSDELTEVGEGIDVMQVDEEKLNTPTDKESVVSVQEKVETAKPEEDAPSPKVEDMNILKQEAPPTSEEADSEPEAEDDTPESDTKDEDKSSGFSFEEID